MKNDTYEVNKKNITVTSIGSLFVLKNFFVVLSDSDLILLLIVIKPKTT